MERLRFSVAMILIVGICVFDGNCQTKEQKTAAALQRCQELLDKGELQNIGDCYNEAMQADPANAPEIFRSGNAAFQSGRVKRQERQSDKC